MKNGRKGGEESGRKLQRCSQSFCPKTQTATAKTKTKTSKDEKRDIRHRAEIDIRLFIFRHFKAHFTDKS